RGVTRSTRKGDAWLECIEGLCKKSWRASPTHGAVMRAFSNSEAYEDLDCGRSRDWPNRKTGIARLDTGALARLESDAYEELGGDWFCGGTRVQEATHLGRRRQLRGSSRSSL